MNSKIKLSILIVSISQFSCVEKVDTSKNQQTLVYDSIKTHQARTLLLKSKQSNSVQKRNRYLNTAMLSTSSALLNAGKGLSNQDCSDLGEDVLYGSSNLVSPNRLVSAEHNIFNSKSNDWFVTFGGNDANLFFADADFNSEDENPLLANRLWQIGLDYWAANSQAHREGTRRDLLKWPVEKDLENAMIQPFNSLKKDIVFLKSLSKTNEDIASDLKFKFNTRAQYDEGFRQYITPYQYEGYTDTGTFEIDQPGVFFNQIVLKPYSTSSINYPKAKVPKGDTYVTPLQLLQTPNWDTFTNQGTTVKLRTSVSTVSGFTDHKINTNTAESKAVENS